MIAIVYMLCFVGLLHANDVDDLKHKYEQLLETTNQLAHRVEELEQSKS